MKKTLPSLMAVFLLASTWCHGQSGCESSACDRDSLVIRTGYDHRNNSLYSSYERDAFFQLIAAPVPITVPAPPYVIDPYDSSPGGTNDWYTLPGTKWISAFDEALYNVNNYPPDTPFVFQTCFCTCEDDSVYLDLLIGADDIVEVILDGISIGNYTAGSYFEAANTIHLTHTEYLTAGSHCLQFHLRNTGNIAMGLNVSGTVFGGGIRSHSCCNPTGNICGVKYADLNGNAIRDNDDPGLPNWQIILKDDAGNPIDTVITDINGEYCFTGLPIGSYYVSEINQPGWTQVVPYSGGDWSLYVDTMDVKPGPFGNEFCETDSGYVDTVYLNTGYNLANDSVYATGLQDEYWTVIQDPNDNLPYGPTVVQTHPAYQPALPNSRWLTGSPVVDGRYTFERCFCLGPEYDDVELNMDFRVDDSAAVFLNGQYIGSSILDPSSFGSPDPTNLQVTDKTMFRAGQNCIRIQVDNYTGPMGLNVNAYVTTRDGDYVVNNCCDTALQFDAANASICGYKFKDEDCDGEHDPGEQRLSNWTIYLLDADQNVIDTDITDMFGEYCFDRLEQGTYYVMEVLQPGWNQSLPGSPDYYHEIELAHNDDEAEAIFGNCEETCFIYQNLTVGTGFDWQGGSPYPTGGGSIDPNWTVVMDPLGNAGINPFVEPYVPTPPTVWNSTSFPSQWITSHSMQNSPPGSYIYEFCFCIKDSVQNISGFFEFRCDDSAVIYVNGNPVTYVSPGTAGSAMPLSVWLNASGGYFTTGKNCVTVEIINTSWGPTGFSMIGNISSSNPYNLKYFQGDECCDGQAPNPGMRLNLEKEQNPEGWLKQCVPNPAGATTTIGYYVPEGSRNAEIELYDMQGRLIRTISLDQTGESEVLVRTGNLKRGIYLYKLLVNGVAVDSKSMVVNP